MSLLLSVAIIAIVLDALTAGRAAAANAAIGLLLLWLLF